MSENVNNPIKLVSASFNSTPIIISRRTKHNLSTDNHNENNIKHAEGGVTMVSKSIARWLSWKQQRTCKTYPRNAKQN